MTQTPAEDPILAAYRKSIDNIDAALIHMLAERFPEITALMYVINSKGNDTITDQDILVYKGADHIVEEMEGLQFKIGPNGRQRINLFMLPRNAAV